MIAVCMDHLCTAGSQNDMGRREEVMYPDGYPAPLGYSMNNLINGFLFHALTTCDSCHSALTKGCTKESIIKT